ncbi:hypothetical protein EZS27_020613 [termite gut metagenome]|uniref:Uncharacterized protein n=1 Tax=termite gut metagenome TaxID=433724 RepID=A0A5J4RDA8_9ZZZZ
MIYLDLTIGLLLLGLSILYHFKNNRSSKKLWLDILLGCYYAATYFVWRYTSNNYHVLSFFHIWIMSAAVIIPFIVFYYVYDHPKLMVWAEIVFGCIGFFVVMSRFISWPLQGYRFIEALPLNLCNVIAFLTFFGLFLKKNSFIKILALSLGFIGGLSSLVMAFNEGLNTFWFIRNVDSYFLHFGLTAYAIFLFLTNKTKIDYRIFLKAIPILTVYYVLMYFMDYLWDLNFLWIRPGTIAFLNTIEAALPSFSVGIFEVNLIYYLLCLVGAFGLTIGLLMLLKKIQVKYQVWLEKLQKHHNKSEIKPKEP